MPGRWQERSSGTSLKTGDENPLKVPDQIQRLLFHRGFEDAALWADLFDPKLGTMKSPWALKDMKPAIDRLVEARVNQEKICLYADFDMDGTSGLALALDAFQQLGFLNVRPIQPQRLKDGYGFHDFIVEELAADGVSLIITIDVGITAIKACQTARELGVDVIITDHHQPGPEKPAALAIINPNQGDCPSGLGYLCGAGVAFTLVRALKRALADAGVVPESVLNLKSLLDLFTIATLTDMVPLVDDNRMLVKHGLKVIEASKRPGIQALLRKLNLNGKELSAQDVAIRFAPKLNALSRLETGLRPLEIYLAPDIVAAEKLVDQVLTQNSERLDLQSHGESVAFELLKEWPHKDFVLLTSKEFHRGVVGLIATKIATETGRPAFIGSENEEGVVVGSARSPHGSPVSVLEALSSATTILQRHGGHPAAAGFEFLMTRKTELIEQLARHHESLDFTREVVVDHDGRLRLGDLNLGLLRWLDALGPFGVDFAVPLFTFENVILENVMPLRGGHQKWILKDPATFVKVDALYFSPPPGLSVKPGSLVSVLGEVQKNDFRGSIKPQILIRDFEMIGPAAQRVVDSSRSGLAASPAGPGLVDDSL